MATTINTRELKAELQMVLDLGIKDPQMIWGPAGIGKSQVVAEVARVNQLELIDLRVSTITPSDLRGLPAVDQLNDISKYVVFDFLPRTNTTTKGILFLDELSLAGTTMQGILQQLILDRRIGSYRFPDSWFIWAAGNQKEDRAGAYTMLGPVANRFDHLYVRPDFEAWKLDYGLANIHPDIVGYLAARPTLFHQPHATEEAWPSARSWTMANRRYRPELGYTNIAPAVGDTTAADFKYYLRVYKDLPDVNEIMLGKGQDISWPSDPDTIWALVTNLTSQLLSISEYQRFENVVTWVLTKASDEWKTRFVTEVKDLAGQTTGVSAYFKKYYHQAFTTTDTAKATMARLALKTASLTADLDSADASSGSGRGRKSK